MMSEQTPLTIYELENDYTYHCDDYARRNIIDNLRHQPLREQLKIIEDLKREGVISENLEEDK